MINIKKIREEFREYLYKRVANNELSEVAAETQYSDADYPRKHSAKLGINYFEAFRNQSSFEKMLETLQQQFKKEGKAASTFSGYKGALISFKNFIDEKYNGIENLLNNSYEQLIISYLEAHGRTTVDELYEYISLIKDTGKTGKRYLREVVTNRYRGSDIFEYDNPFVWLKNNDKVECTLPEELNENIKYTEGSSKTILVNAYERNTKAKKVCIEYYGNDYKCQICGFKFGDKYGLKFKNKTYF